MRGTFNDYNTGCYHLLRGCSTWYSLSPYESRGTRDLGSQFWNQGRTAEIKDRYIHLGGDYDL